MEIWFPGGRWRLCARIILRCGIIYVFQKWQSSLRKLLETPVDACRVSDQKVARNNLMRLLANRTSPNVLTNYKSESILSRLYGSDYAFLSMAKHHFTWITGYIIHVLWMTVIFVDNLCMFCKASSGNASVEFPRARTTVVVAGDCTTVKCDRRTKRNTTQSFPISVRFVTYL